MDLEHDQANAVSMHAVPDSLKTYFKDIEHNYDAIETMMIDKCSEVFEKICNSYSCDDLEWYYYNWVSDLTNYEEHMIIKDLIDPDEVFVDFMKTLGYIHLIDELSMA